MSSIHPIIIEHTQKTHTVGGVSKEFLFKLLMVSNKIARAEVCACFDWGDPGKKELPPADIKCLSLQQVPLADCKHLSTAHCV